jgi:hypothetical protein
VGFTGLAFVGCRFLASTFSADEFSKTSTRARSLPRTAKIEHWRAIVMREYRIIWLLAHRACAQ